MSGRQTSATARPTEDAPAGPTRARRPRGVARLGRLAALVTLVAGTFFVPAATILASDTADQSFAASGSSDVVHDITLQAQTFTAGLTGSLNRVDVRVGRFPDSGDLVVTVRGVSGGVPTADVFATATVPASAVADDGSTVVVTVPLPPSLSTAGAQYAIVLAAPAAAQDSAWIWRQNTTDGYAGGAPFQSTDGGASWSPRGTGDRWFATYVDPTPCASGSWSVTGYGPCTAADPGSFATGPGATSETPCAKGTYQPDAGAAACLPAPIGFYVDSEGATAATACPDGTTTTDPGATSVDACVAEHADPPTIACVATPGVIWPPNGRLVAVHVAVTTTNATSFQLVSATADEGTAADLAGWSVGTDDTTGRVRAARSGAGDGRTYSLVYEAVNATGDTAQCIATVKVPHDQGGE